MRSACSSKAAGALPRLLALALLFACGGKPDTAEQRQRLAGELFEITHGNATVERAFQGVSGPIAANYRDLYLEVAAELQDPGARDAFLADADRRLHDFVQRMFQRIDQQVNLRGATRQALVPVYADNYTAAELRELLGFYRTELGRKVTQLEPAELGRALDTMLAGVLPEIERVLQEALAEERATLRSAAGLSPPPPPPPAE